MFKDKKPMSFFLIVMVSLLIPIIPFAVIGELPGQSWLSAADDNAFLFGVTGTVLLLSDILLPIPSTIVGTMLGARLGFLSGLFWCWSGLMLGNLIGYYLGRAVSSRSGEALPQSPTLLVLAVTRPIPVLAEAVTFTAGAGGVELMPFLFVSFFANGVFAAALAGNGAAFIPSDLFGVGLILPMLLPVAGWLIWQTKFKGKN
ncbi:MAG: VTT domain-containing protein [Methylomonas sp.]|jgi:membrane protein YqaA with SNARE-associated domain|uniref:hypothetical protein n=1 Tax=Methylomonas sp. TaxID=418 RepID=UPI0025E52801|nr:hypothetical protein [Methylomonas sp.]MCK9607047.1 VTT domain-containing protein [Methylomonas sp.]